MDILIVEDDDFKAADISRTLEECLASASLIKASSVTSALRSIAERDFDLVLLDMSLPTFDLSNPGGGGSPQGQGGVEVLRLAKRLKRTASFIVITQYPDIELDGREIALADAPPLLAERFGLNIKACIDYQFDEDDWKSALLRALPKDDAPGEMP